MHLKTSQRISLYITIFVATLTALFFLILNTFFFVSRYRDEPRGFQQRNKDITIIPQKELLLGFPNINPNQGDRWQERAIRLSNSAEFQNLETYFNINNIRKIDDRRRMMVPNPRGIIVLLDVTQNINRQESLGLYSLILWISIVILSFLLSGSVVRISLKDLANLSSSVKDTDISKLGEEHRFDHLPEDDEINTIAHAINTMKRTIANQVSSLKEFLAFASHELKTPLMVIQSSAESASYSKDYTSSLANIKTGVDSMQHIIDQLNQFVKLDGNVFQEKSATNISDVLEHHLKSLELVYKDKNIQIEKEIEHNLIINTYPNVVNNIISNLIDNAFKYGDSDGAIKIKAGDNSITISNTGPTITPKNLASIRKPFWQQDKTHGHGSGLGLAIVKKSVDYLGRTIQATSLDDLTTFKLTRKSN